MSGSAGGNAFPKGEVACAGSPDGFPDWQTAIRVFCNALNGQKEQTDERYR